jgi:AcrR family transcriptional regulator
MGKTVEKDTSERPTGRMSAGDRRQQILDVAIRLFSQKGFRGTTTKEIALAAGVNEAIIFRHFATKKELYAAILDKKACMIEEDGRHAETEEAMQRGDDRKGCANVLSDDRSAPCGGTTYNTCLIHVEPAPEHGKRGPRHRSSNRMK